MMPSVALVEGVVRHVVRVVPAAGVAAGAETTAAEPDASAIDSAGVTAPSGALPAWATRAADHTEDTADPVGESFADARYAHGLRISAALDRLAERVRAGEIDVSSVAPEAPDAAVLASVLAALLGGASRR